MGIKIKRVGLVVAMFGWLFISNISANDKEVKIDTSSIHRGIVKVSYIPKNIELITKVLVSYKGTSSSNKLYTYDLNHKGVYTLQNGSGAYDIIIVEKTKDNPYGIVINKQTVEVQDLDDKVVFTQSTDMCEWGSEMIAIKRAKEITKDVVTDVDKVKRVYRYIIQNISYDHIKASKIQSLYKANIDETLTSQKGICYDYAILTASMLRSLGLPTKIVFGYCDGIKEYHAWNEVFIKELGSWVIIDTTKDAELNKTKTIESIYKDKGEYKSEKVY